MNEKQLNNLPLIIIVIVLFGSLLFFDYVLNEKEKAVKTPLKIELKYNGVERKLK
jgi:hypothetical protein